MDYSKNIAEYIDLERNVLSRLDVNAINSVLKVLDGARRRNATIYIFGNGGSATTASHFAGDFNKGVSEKLDIPFRFVCLNDNLSALLAVANDLSYDEIFIYQLRKKLTKDDVVIGISGSGNSSNVIKAIAYAKEVGATTVGLTGYDGGKLKNNAELSLHVPVMNMQISEDIHLVFNHLMVAVLCKTLCGIDNFEGANE